MIYLILFLAGAALGMSLTALVVSGRMRQLDRDLARVRVQLAATRGKAEHWQAEAAGDGAALRSISRREGMRAELRRVAADMEERPPGPRGS